MGQTEEPADVFEYEDDDDEEDEDEDEDEDDDSGKEVEDDTEEAGVLLCWLVRF